MGLNDICSDNKRSPVEQINSSQNSFTISTPPPIKRLQAFREKLMTNTDEWNYEPKMMTPRVLSPVCSPSLHYHKLHDPIHFHAMHFHDFNAYHPCDHLHNVSTSTNCASQTSPQPSDNHLKNPSKHAIFQTDSGSDNNCYDQRLSLDHKKIHRTKSCPKDLFSLSSKCSENEKIHNDMADEDCLRQLYKADQACYINGMASGRVSRHRHNDIMKNCCKTKDKPKSKTPNSMDEFLSSKLVRSNLAANLRQKNSRQKIHELEEEKLKETMHVSSFIPKCHHWNVRDTIAWKNFTTEE